MVQCHLAFRDRFHVHRHLVLEVLPKLLSLDRPLVTEPTGCGLHGTVALVTHVAPRETRGMRSHPRRHVHHLPPAPSSAFAGFRFPPDVITLAVRWYLRFGLS